MHNHLQHPGWKWEGGILAELDVMPPPVELFYANDLPVTLGQYQGRVNSRSPKSTGVVSLRFDLDRNSKWARVEFSAAIANEQNALIVHAPRRDESIEGSAQMEVGNVDLVSAHIFGRSTSSLRDIVFLEIAGSVRFGTVTSNGGANQNSAAHAIPASSFGTNMIVKTPAGGSYWRVSSTAYLKQGRVNDRLAEQETPGALVFDSGIGYRKDQLSIELKLENIFDRSYWYHNRPTTSAGYRIPAKGRSLGFQLLLAL